MNHQNIQRKALYKSSYLSRQLLVFFALTNNRVYKITCFLFQVGLANKEHKDLYSFRTLLEGSSPTSSDLILIESSVTKVSRELD
jgi:hypothetical protein